PAVAANCWIIGEAAIVLGARNNDAGTKAARAAVELCHGVCVVQLRPAGNMRRICIVSRRGDVVGAIDASVVAEEYRAVGHAIICGMGHNGMMVGMRRTGSHQVLIPIKLSPPSVLRHRSTPPTMTRFALVGSPAQIALPYHP